LYIVAIYSAGVTQGLMWRAFDETGRLAYPDFVETVVRLFPMYVVRVLGGTLFFTGTCLCGVNMYKTWQKRPAQYTVDVHEAPALAPIVGEPSPAGGFLSMAWHRTWERKALLFSVLSAVAVISASLFEIIPTFLIRSNVPTIAGVKPYTPLELAGRDIYIGEGCYNCHSQMIRPMRAETERYGEYSKPGEFIYDHPFQWGSRRIGPDLHRQGGKYPSLWHVRHMQDPPSITPRSIMPAFAWLLTDDLDFPQIQKSVDAMVMLGVPYGDAVNRAEAMAHEQAGVLAADIEQQGGPKGLAGKKIIALVAYLQRLGTDIRGPVAPAAAAAAAPAAAPAAAAKGATP
jgi:cytochrome c oxidase cbb3-type subunit I/II